MLRVTIVGELNPYGADPRYALFDLPEGASGHRLRTLVMGVRRTTYHRFRKVNLCTGIWNSKNAEETASNIPLDWHPDTDAPIVLLGQKVASVFGFSDRKKAVAPATQFTVQSWPVTSGGIQFLLLPHPSGLNRVWCDSSAFDRAKVALYKAIPSVCWGEEAPMEVRIRAILAARGPLSVQQLVMAVGGTHTAVVLALWGMEGQAVEDQQGRWALCQ